jgi:hypothetical protein
MNMQKDLTEADRLAIDLLLNKTGDKAFSAPVPDERVRAAGNVLKLLGEMPEESLPADLLARTLKRIRAAGPSGRVSEPGRLQLPSDGAGPVA